MNQLQFVRLPVNNRFWSIERTGQQWQQILIDVRIWLPKPYTEIMKKRKENKKHEIHLFALFRIGERNSIR